MSAVPDMQYNSCLVLKYVLNKLFVHNNFAKCRITLACLIYNANCARKQNWHQTIQKMTNSKPTKFANRNTRSQLKYKCNWKHLTHLIHGRHKTVIIWRSIPTFMFLQRRYYFWKSILSGAKIKALNTWERRTSGWKLFKNLNELLQETEKFAWRSGSWANFKISISERKYFWRKMSASQLFKLKEEKYGSKQKYDAAVMVCCEISGKVWKYGKYKNMTNIVT